MLGSGNWVVRFQSGSTAGWRESCEEYCVIGKRGLMRMGRFKQSGFAHWQIIVEWDIHIIDQWCEKWLTDELLKVRVLLRSFSFDTTNCLLIPRQNLKILVEP